VRPISGSTTGKDMYLIPTHLLRMWPGGGMEREVLTGMVELIKASIKTTPEEEQICRGRSRFPRRLRPLNGIPA